MALTHPILVEFDSASTPYDNELFHWLHPGTGVPPLHLARRDALTHLYFFIENRHRILVVICHPNKHPIYRQL